MPGPQRESNHTSTAYCRKPAGRIYAASTTQQKQKAAYLKRDKRLLAGVEGFEPSARGFGDRCSTN